MERYPRKRRKRRKPNKRREKYPRMERNPRKRRKRGKSNKRRKGFLAWNGIAVNVVNHLYSVKATHCCTVSSESVDPIVNTLHTVNLSHQATIR